MKRIISIVLIITMILTAASAADTTNQQTLTEEQEALNKVMDDFCSQLADFIPKSITGMNLWADAHIGNIIPLSGLPHLGAGATMGGVLIPTNLMKTFAAAFPKKVKEWESFPLPAISFDARVGGLFLPFDVGVHLMALEGYEKEFFGVKVEMTNILSYGADIRFAILQESLVLPALSIGLGYTKARGEFSLTTTDILPDNASQVISGAIGSLTGNETQRAFTILDVAYNTDIYTMTLQLSKKILLLTPFIGAKAVGQNGKYTYSYTYDKIEGQNYSSEIKSVERKLKFDDLTNSNIKFSVFAGLGVDFLIIQTTLGVNYDFSDKSWAGSISLHVKI